MLALLLVWAAPTLSHSDDELILRNLPNADAALKTLRVYVEPYREGQPAVLGKVRAAGATLHFTPRFGLTPGLTYRVEAGTFRDRITIPKPDRKPTTTVQVFPSGDRLPENLLKFYLHFSAPMSRGDIYKHVRLRDEAGKPIDMPFLELDEELWDPTGRRLTLFLDPGRIKRGLKPREDIGPVLEEGKTYTLEIADTWHDAADVALKGTVRKRFKVSAPLESQPEINRWKLTAPQGMRPLIVNFDRPLDHALAQRLISVTSATGEPIAGIMALSKNETVGSFTPAKPWAVGEYRLVADTRLEDQAGNSLGRPFELDILRPVEKKIPVRTQSLSFSVTEEKGKNR
jgi:hypothetical protein